MRKLNLFLKRIFDLIASVIGIAIISPLLIIISILIKLTSEGPILFKQERLGKDGHVFKVLKFRTMVVNAEKIGAGIRVNSENDSRITKIGKVLRKTSLDELPQLFNVVKGEMSLVGPRPPLTYHPYKYNDYNENQRKRFDMRPGITGLAQVTVRNSVSWDGRIPIDIKYVENFNVLEDVKILFLTILKVFKRESIYGNSIKLEEKNNV